MEFGFYYGPSQAAAQCQPSNDRVQPYRLFIWRGVAALRAAVC